jgi:hypothetical protein
MPNPSARNSGELPIPTALSSGDFDAARRMIENYGTAVRQDASTEPDPVKGAEILQRALVALQDYLHLARVLRAHISSQLRVEATTSQYKATGSPYASSSTQRGIFELEG